MSLFIDMLKIGGLVTRLGSGKELEAWNRIDLEVRRLQEVLERTRIERNALIGAPKRSLSPAARSADGIDRLWTAIYEAEAAADWLRERLPKTEGK